MWYSFTKLSETEDSVVYAFGYESRERTGRLEYDKKTKKTTVLQDSANKTYFADLSYATYQLIERCGAPDEKTIAYG